MATDRDQITFWVLVEELKVFGEGTAKGLHCLRVQIHVVIWLPEFFGFVFVDHLDLLLGCRHWLSAAVVTFAQGRLSSNTL